MTGRPKGIWGMIGVIAIVLSGCNDASTKPHPEVAPFLLSFNHNVIEPLKARCKTAADRAETTPAKVLGCDPVITLDMIGGVARVQKLRKCKGREVIADPDLREHDVHLTAYGQLDDIRHDGVYRLVRVFYATGAKGTAFPPPGFFFHVVIEEDSGRIVFAVRGLEG